MRHAQVSILKGTVVKVDGPFEGHFQVVWKGWDPFDKEREDWTWDWAILEDA